jgi:hypothetical protein
VGERRSVRSRCDWGRSPEDCVWGDVAARDPYPIARCITNAHGPSQLERLALFDVKWPHAQGTRWVADDAESPGGNEGAAVTPFELERIYRGLRKNREDVGDRVDAHAWPVSEMETGRKAAPFRSLRRIARECYRVSSNYGLSVGRPVPWLLLLCGLGWLLLSVRVNGMCHVEEIHATCVGWAGASRVALRAVFLQGVPDGVRLSGTASDLVWVFLRLTGATMLFQSIWLSATK